MKNKNIGILTLAKYTCGPWVALSSGVVYVFIHYSLLIAYIAEAGDILSSTINLPQWTGWCSSTFFFFSMIIGII